MGFRRSWGLGCWWEFTERGFRCLSEACSLGVAFWPASGDRLLRIHDSSLTNIHLKKVRNLKKDLPKDNPPSNFLHPSIYRHIPVYVPYRTKKTSADFAGKHDVEAYRASFVLLLHIVVLLCRPGLASGSVSR